MAWCPKCRNEYIEGITICKDCNEPLVNSLEEYDKNFNQNQYLDDNDVLSDEDSEGCGENEEIHQSENNLLTGTSHAYVKKEYKYKDLLSSAYTLLIVGFGGLFALLLVVTNIIDLNLAAPGKYITYSGIGALLVIFVVIGLHSLRASKKLAKEADAENQLTADIMEWFNKNITPDLIENGINDEIVEEMKYFKRIENIKEIISKAYGDLNEAYLDKLAEDIYQDKL